MTDVSRLLTVRHALHSDSSTFTGTPGTLFPLRCTDDVAGLYPRNRVALARNLRSQGGRRYSHARGSQDVADITLATEFRGVDANSGGAVTAWEAKMEQGLLLQSMFGAVAPATTGVAPTIAASGHTPLSGILAVAGLTTANGQVIAFKTTTGLQMGRIFSGGGTTSLTLNHSYTGTPTTGETVFRMAVYTVSDSVTHHVHAFLTGEGESWRRDYSGCAPMSMALSLASGQIVGMSSVFSPTSWADVAEADPAHAEPTAGSPIVADRVRLMIDGVEYFASNLSINYNNATQIRDVDTIGGNGRLGGVCGAGDGKSFTIEGEILIGATSPALTGELTDPTLVSFLGSDVNAGAVSTVRSVTLMVGSDVGAIMYALLPTADFVASTAIVNGLSRLKFTAVGAGPSSAPAILAVG
jgi:hypothetical protein